MIYTITINDITKHDEEIIFRLLSNIPTYDKFLFLELAAPDFIPCFKENTCKGDIIYNNIILRKALVTSMLLFKLNLQIECNCRRFSTEELAESILEDMEIGEKRDEAVQKLSEDIKKYNKAKLRIYFQHTSAPSRQKLESCTACSARLRC